MREEENLVSGIKFLVKLIASIFGIYILIKLVILYYILLFYTAATIVFGICILVFLFTG